MAKATEAQRKGAEVQKGTVRRKITDAMDRLRETRKGVASAERREITIEDVLKESTVAFKTLKKGYHCLVLQKVYEFLDEMNLGVAVAKPKRASRPRKTSIFKQNDELMQRIGALRYRLNIELEQKQRQIDALTARVAALMAELANTRRPTSGQRPRSTKPTTRRKNAA